MTMDRISQRDVEYDRRETIAVLDGWLHLGESFYPIDTAISALHWLDASPPETATHGDHPQSFEETRKELRAWLANDAPHFPEALGDAVLYWLERADRAQSSPLSANGPDDERRGSDPHRPQN
jgi:hypothetical protein